MNDYKKWDNIEDSDEEVEKRQNRCRSYEDEAAESRRCLQAEIDNWLRRQISKLPRDGDPTTKRLQASMPEIGANRTAPTPFRNVSKAEREALAMLIAVSHFEEGDTNLDRHAIMLDLARHHRWMEEDPGALELLCRVHNHVMKEGSEHGGRHTREFEDPEHHRMRNMVLCGINTLSAPKRAKCPGGLLELFTLICTPTDEASRELRRKWQTKDFAKDALFDSLFPDLRQYTDDNMDDGFGSDFWIIIVLGLLAVVGIIAFIVLYYNGTLAPLTHSPVKRASNLSNISNDSGIASTVASAAASVVAGAASASASGTPVANAPAPAIPAMKLACADSNEGCAYWAEIGQCKSNPEYMLVTCKLSCGVCQVSAPAAAPGSAASDAFFEPAASGDPRAGEL